MKRRLIDRPFSDSGSWGRPSGTRGLVQAGHALFHGGLASLGHREPSHLPFINSNTGMQHRPV